MGADGAWPQLASIVRLGGCAAAHLSTNLMAPVSARSLGIMSGYCTPLDGIQPAKMSRPRWACAGQEQQQQLGHHVRVLRGSSSGKAGGT